MTSTPQDPDPTTTRPRDPATAVPPPPGRLLAIDYGRVRVGLASCDELGITTRPLGFVRRESDVQVATIVAEVAKKERVVALVIGLPVHANGQAGANVRWVRDFVRLLAARCPLPVHEVDERYSSGEAEQALRDEGRWPPKDKGDIDAKSAAILLRRYLDGER